LKFFPKCFGSLAVLIIGFECAKAGIGLSPAAENAIAASGLEEALYRLMALPDGSVMARRPPVESRAQLDSLIRQSASNAELYAVRAQEDERQLDFKAAEKDWREAAELSRDKPSALSNLADFYHRRLQPREEVQVLLQSANLPAHTIDAYQSDSEQAAWRAIQRALQVSSDSQLPAEIRAGIYEAWIKRYPKDIEPLQEYFRTLIRAKDIQGARTVATRIHSAFPGQLSIGLETDSQLARLDHGDQAALAVYEKQFSPLWPAELRAGYFALLSDAHQLRAFLAEARSAAAANPTAYEPPLRMFFYYEQQGKQELAGRQLLELQARRTVAQASWTATELKALGSLFTRVADYDEAAHAYYSLYALPGATDGDKSLAMASLIDLLLDVPEQSLQLGARDLSIYRNVATLDRHPGFLNGILSLVLNTTLPEDQYQAVSQTSIAYFHRATAARLIERMKHEFPGSGLIAPREAKLFSAYSVYGEKNAILRRTPPWLAAHKDSPEYTKVALLLGETYAATRNFTQELALYDGLLEKLGEASGHRPLGDISDRVLRSEEAKASPARSPEYAQVLDLYVSRLTQLNRLTDAVGLYRHEIDRNPDDPGIYERLALFVEQNHFDSELEQTYRSAVKKFDGTGWPNKLARFYLRKHQTTAYQALARELTAKFDGSKLAEFISAVPPGPTFSALVYRQVNLYAHQRFPHNLTFVRNLLASYQAKGYVDMAAYEKLLRENWFYSANLRTEFFEYLSRTTKLAAELAALPSVEQAVQQKNTAALTMYAEGKAWLADFENAGPAFVDLADLVPGDEECLTRAISVERSLAASVPGAFDTAIRLAEQTGKAMPADSVAATQVGEIYADREQFAKAAAWWNRIATMRPGVAEGYLDAATVFWDYYQFSDSLRVLESGRHATSNPALYSYQAGAIHENQNDYDGAIDEYLQSVLAPRRVVLKRPKPADGKESNGEEVAGERDAMGQNRLIQLAKRKQTSVEIERRTAALAAAKPFNSAAFHLRLALLEDQDRRADIHALLADSLERLSDLDQVDLIQTTCERLGFDDVSALALQREAALNTDPVEKLASRLKLAKVYQAHKDLTRAESEFAALLAENPNSLGIVRANIDFYWAEKQPKKAVTTLEEAASRAQPPYRDQLRREAAQKATDSDDFTTARRLLDTLLNADPYNGGLLAAKAATYAREGDNKSLIEFYSAQLGQLKSSTLSEEEKVQRTASLRRGYINALITAKQFDEALEQYEALLNVYPEDEHLPREMAHFAEANHLVERLTKYYEKATADSPRNYRWPMVLARIYTSLRRYPEAVAALNKAVYVRPDRTDLFIAKADLETRLLRFDDALKTYQKLYEASYHDSQYLVSQASVHARLGQNAETVRLLKAAFVEAHPKELNGYIEVMSQLAAWHMNAEVDQIYQEAKPFITASSGDYRRIATVEGQALVALRRPVEALETVASVRRVTGDPKHPWSLQPQVDAIGAGVDDLYTPEEKAAFAVKLETPMAIPTEMNVYDLACASGFAELAAKRLYSSIIAHRSTTWRNLELLQSSRLLNRELAHQLEAVRASVSTQQEEAFNAAMLAAYTRAGDTATEMRLSEARLAAGAGLTDPIRYAHLLVQSHADLATLVSKLSAVNAAASNLLVQELVTMLPEDQALAVIESRGANLPSLWTHAYSALAGLYFLSPKAAAQFDATLGPRVVGAQLSSAKGDGLRGAVWYYYAARYGDYLTAQRNTGAADLVAATVEASPIASDSYVAWGMDEFELGQFALATRAYEQALELSPDRADVHILLAEAAHSLSHSQESIGHLKTALELLTRQVNQGAQTPDYYQTAETALTRMNDYAAVNELRPAVDVLLGANSKKNQSYQFLPFVEGILSDAADRKAALDWVFQLARTPELSGLPEQLIGSALLTEPEKRPLYAMTIEINRAELAKSAGEAANQARQSLQKAQAAYASYLNQQGQAQEAWRVLHQIEPKTERSGALLLELAAKTGRLSETFAQYDSGTLETPQGEQMLIVASSFAKDHPEWSLQIREWEYQRELRTENAPAAAYFGLAEVRIQQKRTDEALALLRDVTLSVGAPFENLPSAIDLLEKHGLKQNAADYAREWRKAEPWNPEAIWAVARTTEDKGLLDSLRKSNRAVYSLRAQAARALRDLKAPLSGTTELDLLTHEKISPQEASQPFFVLARLRAGETTPDVKLYTESIALKPSLHNQRLALAEAAFLNKQEALGLAAWNSYDSTHEIGWLHSAALDGAIDPGADRTLKVQEMVAGVLAKQKQYAAAEALYGRMLQQSEDRAFLAHIEKLKAAVAVEATREQVNRSRAPTISAEFTQAGIVRPKVAGGSE
jgi:lipopolysaccharide biosynthesis regulator YciM